MANLEKYMGVIPAFYACYDSEGKINTERVKQLTEYFVNQGAKGVYVNGSSGECIYLRPDERKAVLEAVVEAAKGRLTIICHVACNNTEDSMELAAHSESLGVDAIAAIPPIYFRLPDHAIAKYWNDMSSAAPNTDFVIYNIPQLAGVSLTIPLLKEMRKNKNVIGVKNSSMPTQDIQMFAVEMGDDGIVFNGPDEQFISGLAIGAKGGIGGTYGSMPKLFTKMYELVQAGDFESARPIQNAVNEVIFKMCEAKGNLYAVIKEVLRINEGLDIGSVRAPLAPLQDGDKAIAEEAAGMIRVAYEKYL
ncbi:MAG: dihydrodipicolinate synthase family protein [Firmicutes bacterium]|nr:dihydrodipicolinate synthase family protein [Bacillota bacterium]